MITTVTINAAVDYTVKTSELKLDQVNRVECLHKAAAGKGINVAKTVKNLGGKVKALGCLGGASGRFIADSLKQQDIITDFNWISSETRINMKVIDDLGRETKINQLGIEVSNEILTEVNKKVIEEVSNSEIIVLAGSLPPDCPNDYYQQLINQIDKSKTKVFLDTSKEPLKLALKAKPTLIKPNHKELEEIYNKKLSLSDIIEISKELVKEGIEIILVSRGEEGAILTSKEGTWQATPPKINPKSTVGAGDSLVGGIAIGYLKGYNIDKILRFAVAISVATILEPGTEVGNLAEAKRWLDKIEIEKLA